MRCRGIRRQISKQRFDAQADPTRRGRCLGKARSALPAHQRPQLVSRHERDSTAFHGILAGLPMDQTLVKPTGAPGSGPVRLLSVTRPREQEEEMLPDVRASPTLLTPEQPLGNCRKRDGPLRNSCLHVLMTAGFRFRLIETRGPSQACVF